MWWIHGTTVLGHFTECRSSKPCFLQTAELFLIWKLYFRRFNLSFSYNLVYLALPLWDKRFLQSTAVADKTLNIATSSDWQGSAKVTTSLVIIEKKFANSTAVLSALWGGTAGHWAKTFKHYHANVRPIAMLTWRYLAGITFTIVAILHVLISCVLSEFKTL